MVSTPLILSASMTRCQPSVSFCSASAGLASAVGAAVSNITSSGAVAFWAIRMEYRMWYTSQSQLEAHAFHCQENQERSSRSSKSARHWRAWRRDPPCTSDPLRSNTWNADAGEDRQQY